MAYPVCADLVGVWVAPSCDVRLPGFSLVLGADQSC